MLNVTINPGSLQGQLDVWNLFSAEPQGIPQIRSVTGSPVPNQPRSVFLRPGSSWYSPGNTFRLTLQQSDGNLVLQTIIDAAIGEISPIGGSTATINPDNPYIQLWAPIWSPHIQGKGVTVVAFQEDGNLVAYAGNNAVWNSGTSGRKLTDRPTLVVQDDGNLVIYTVGPKAIWTTNTSSRNSSGFNTPT